MPIAKSSTIETPPPQVQPLPPPTGIAGYEWEGIPLDVGRMMGISIMDADTKTLDKLRDISKWSKEGLLDNTIGNQLQKIRTLEEKLGSPALNETRIDKMWRWVKLASHINELRMRQEAFER